jgi:uncharacterized protein
VPAEKTVHTNQLIDEKSPYLQQHAHNPVNWYPWGEAAFAKARSEDKPIFLSIGYSTCHWCHVMERESFESEEIAEVLNRYFIPIKVDREERPDVDRIYMTFIQATTGGGGWPMSVWLTPDLKAFYGGTYFPPDSRWGRPGFKQILEHLAEAWRSDRERIVKSGDDVLEELEKHVRIAAAHRTADAAALDSCFYQFRRTFDTKLGGFGGAPKFPRAVAFNFLLRYYYRTKNEEALEMVLVTLREMAKGGMNDQLGGGFHRYSVDARWFVPHFEKMLYDQAQLAVCYVEAYQITHDAAFERTAREILDYVLRDMTDREGGFYSAEDADSVVDPAEPHEKGEGAFYVWTREEIDVVAGSPAADWFSYRYGVEPNGNVAEDPHNEFSGKNILYQRHTPEETAQHFNIAVEAVVRALGEAASQLMAVRDTRVRPHLDDKILSAWNGLMISAFAKASRALNEPRYLEAAQRASAFIARELYRDGVLLRRYRAGEGAIPGFLDDYAFFTQALLDLYEADFDGSHIEMARRLANTMLDLFEDRTDGGFYSTAEGDRNLVMRIKEDYDGAEPSGNSVAITVLLRLGHITGEERYIESAERALRAFTGRMESAPSTVPQMFVALMESLTPPRHVVLAGEPASLKEFTAILGQRFLPSHSVLWAGTAGINPTLAGMQKNQTNPTAYVCENFACNLPTEDVQRFAELLQ